MDPAAAISIIPILIEAFDEALTAEMLAIMAMFAAGTLLLATSAVSLVLAIRGQ
jgi:hypothetical protein